MIVKDIVYNNVAMEKLDLSFAALLKLKKFLISWKYNKGGENWSEVGGGRNFQKSGRLPPKSEELADL